MSQFTKILVVSPLADGRTWYLWKEFGYDVGREGSGETIHVPAGFLTDFASIPRPLWAILPRWGKYGNAAVLHDYLYWVQTYPRKRADEIFLEAMAVLQVPWLTRKVMYRSVRLFGGIAWWSNRRLRKRGEERITMRQPEKSTEMRGDERPS
jgi:hypothetical protein